MKEISLREMYGNLNELEQRIIIMRLKGNTYKRIEKFAIKNDSRLSSRLVRKLIDDVIHLDANFYRENKYAKIFQILKFDEESFIKVFDEPLITYLFLSYRIKNAGMLSVPKYLYRSVSCLYVNYNGISIPFKATTFTYWILIINAINNSEISYSGQDIYDIADSKLSNVDVKWHEKKKYEDALKNERNAVEIQTGKYIFFDNRNLDKKLKQFYKSITRKNGIYNIDLIFEEDEKFYKSLGINSGLSLHDLVNKYRGDFESSKIIKVLPYPNILYGYPSKIAFFKSIAIKYKNMSVPNVVNKIHNLGGVDKEYLRINLKSLNRHIINKDGVIKVINLDFTDRQKELLEKKLTKDYYLSEELLTLIRTVKPTAPSRILETNIIYELGYRKEYNCFMKREIKDIRKHIEKHFSSHNFLNLNVNNDLNLIELDVINSMINRLKLVRISDNELITAKKLKTIGIYKKNLLEFLKEVSTTIGEGSYFTVNQLFKHNRFSLIENSNFENRFYEELIKSSDKFTEIRIDGNTLYCVTRKKIKGKDFVSWVLKDIEHSIHMKDVIDRIYEMYKFTISQNTLRALVQEIGYYYDDTFEKIYKNKKVFLAEVFKYE